MKKDAPAECPCRYLSAVSVSLIRDYLTAKTPESKSQAQAICLVVGKLILNSTHALAEIAHGKGSADALTFRTIGERLIDTGRPWAQEDLWIEFCPPDATAVLKDQVENLTQIIFLLTEEVRQMRSPSKIVTLKVRAA